jgi:FkbM family methyltransferase
VREPLRFTARQATRRGQLARYRLRGSEVVVYVRHNTPDVNTLDQILLQGHYELPPPAAKALARAKRPLEVLDLGANVGVFAAYVFESDPGARVVCFEPDAENAAVVRRSIEANPGLSWELVEACAAAENGVVRFTSGLFTNSRVETNGEGDLLPAVDIFPAAAEAAYLKIDIEGAEWALLADPRFASLPARIIALEYHDYLCPGPDPARLAREALERGGYDVAEAGLETTPGHGMLWGWKSS